MIFKRLVKKRIAFSLLLSLFLQLYAIPYTLYPTYAADATPSTDIKTKLEELKKEIASKAAKLKGEINTKLQNKAYVGNVKTKTQSSITLATKTGAKIISVNQDSEFKSNIKSKKNLTLKTLSEEDFIVALGDIDETGVLTARKLILLPQPKAGQPLADKTYLWGQIVSISEKLATLKNRDSKNIAISLPSETLVKNLDFVILTGFIGKNDIFEAEFVHVVAAGVIRPKGKISTSSAQVSTKSAQPKSTPSGKR